jgi:TonB-linked SusC/RagA family outer membrane protein
MKKILLFIGFVLLMAPAFAQVSGTVFDENNNTLPGVNVIIKGTTTGVVSDLDGNFSIEVKKGDILSFRYVGYQNQDVTVESLTKKYNIYLKPDVVNMDEVVVMGYSNKTKTEVASAVSVLSSDKLLDVTTDDVGSMLQGKVSGVQVVNESGQPGSGSQIRIRGISTIKPGNEEPLYVVDGIIGGTFDPNDVESLTVLKDAGATGMYGARANKGVIIVTTKQGTSGKTRFNFKASVGMKTADQGNLKMMNGQQFFDWSSELYRDPETHEIDKIKFYKYYPRELAEQNYDWVNNGFKPAMTQQYHLSASGRSDKFSYYVSGNYFNDKGTFRNTGYEKINLRLNTEYRFNKNVSLKNNINTYANKGTYYDYMDMYYTYLALPWDNPYNDDGSIKYIDGNTSSKWWSRDKINPFHTIDNSDHNSKGFGLDYDMVLKVKITNWLSFSSSNRLSFSTDKSHDFVSPITAGPFHDKGYIREQQNNWWGGITTNMLNFNFDLGKSSITGLAGVEFNGGSNDYLWVEGKGLPEGFDVPSVASSEIKIGGTSTLEYFNSLISQVNYNYDKRYFLTASFRADQTSNFPPENNTAYFPSVAASWLVSNEGFFKDNVSFMDMLKLRASYGITGDPDIGASRYMGLFSLSSQYNNNSAAIPYQLANNNLTWERTNEINIGVDMSFFKRISFSADFYNNVTKDLIVLVAQPLSQGFEHRWENAGQVTNKGIELNLNAIAVKTHAIEWNIGINFAKNSNILSGIENPFYNTVNGVSQIYRNDASIYTFILPKWLGVDSETGAPLWEKINDDGSREPTSKYKDATPQEVGKALPDFVGGATTSVSWKGLTLYASMAYQYGNDIYNYANRFMDNDGHEPYINAIVPKSDWKRWERPGDIATHPSMQNAELSTENSSRYLEDGSFIKIRNISLSYMLPKAWSSKISMREVVVSLRADNVYTWTNYWGQDPEVTLSKGDWSMPGVSDFKYPNNHQFVVNVNFKF